MAATIKPLFLMLLLTAGLAGCGGSNNSPSNSTAKPPDKLTDKPTDKLTDKPADKPAASPAASAAPPPEVEVMVAAKSNATLTQDLPGRLQAYRTAQVRARVDGVIEKRLFREGSDVQAGAPLFQIDAHIYKATAESAQADLLLARQTLERYKTLMEIKAVSQQDFDLAVAKAKQAEAVAIRASEDLKNASVPAAISGHIGRALVSEGALVGKAEGTLLATIEQINPIYANFTQSSADLLRMQQAVKQGKLKNAASAKVELLLEDGSVYPLPGKISFSDMAIDPGTGSVSLRAEFPNPKRELLPGMFVRLRYAEARAENVIRIPQRAVQIGAQGQFVMIVGADSKATPLPVKSGSMAGSDFIIAEGLKGGEQVIVNGLQKARPGSLVKPVPLANGKP